MIKKEYKTEYLYLFVDVEHEYNRHHLSLHLYSSVPVFVIFEVCVFLPFVICFVTVISIRSHRQA